MKVNSGRTRATANAVKINWSQCFSGTSNGKGGKKLPRILSFAYVWPRNQVEKKNTKYMMHANPCSPNHQMSMGTKDLNDCASKKLNH